MTKNKSKPITLLLALLIGTISFAQNIDFNYTDGTNASYNLEDIRKIYFDTDIMNLQLWDGTLYSWNVSKISHYKYDESYLNVQEVLSNANELDVAFFPNPTCTYLNVRFNLPKEDAITFSLYDMQGKLILDKNLGKLSPGEHQESLDISNLPESKYVCRIIGLYQSVSKSIIKTKK
jgi:hypothetical protein